MAQIDGRTSIEQGTDRIRVEIRAARMITAGVACATGSIRILPTTRSLAALQQVCVAGGRVAIDLQSWLPDAVIPAHHRALRRPGRHRCGLTLVVHVGADGRGGDVGPELNRVTAGAAIG